MQMRSIQLDVIRALAILLVIGAHFKFSAPDGVVGTVAYVWHEWGGFGVPLFFTLSGYLVGGLLISEMRNHGGIDVGRFLIRRGLKIWPAYFVLLAYLFAMPLLKGVPFGELVSDYWPNVIFVNNYIGPNPALHTWSLAVEEHFYLALPFVLLALIRFGGVALIAPLCLIAPLVWTVLRAICALTSDPYLIDSTMPATHLWLDGLLAGVGVRALVEFTPKVVEVLHAWRWPLIAGGIALIACLALPWPALNGVSLYKILPVRVASSTAILMGGLHLSMTAWWAAGLAWIGRHSDSIYLWHVTMIGVVYRILSPFVQEGSVVQWIFAAGVTVSAAVLFGGLMSRLVEWPVVSFRDRFFPAGAGRHKRAKGPEAPECGPIEQSVAAIPGMRVNSMRDLNRPL